MDSKVTLRRALAADAFLEVVGRFPSKLDNLLNRASYSSPQTFSSSRLMLLTAAGVAAAAFFVFAHSMQPWHWMLLIGITSSVAAF